jgi:glycosyltransferase involved in cell wall biosynthesis
MDYSIIYFAFVSSSFGGVEQKIIAQFDALQAIHKNTHLFLVSSFSPGGVFKEEIEKRVNVNTLINTASKVTNPWLRRQEKFEMITNSLNKFDAAKSIVYFRFPGADYHFFKFLKTNVQYHFVTEHQEIENKLRVGSFNGVWRNDLIDFIFGKMIRRRITGFVGVSSQYLDNQKSYLSLRLQQEKFFLVNGNGIDSKKYQIRSYNIKDTNVIKMLFVGSVYKSHGLHRLIKSIDFYYKKYSTSKRIELHIAGAVKNSTYLEKYIRNKEISQSVIFHGFLTPDEINVLANSCHIAVNSLALHRIGLYITSTLKSREYFARGIPFITSSSDDDFKDNNPYIKKLPSNDNLIDIMEIINFVNWVHKKLNHPFEMRDYAEQNLDWQHKMEKLKLFLDKVMLSFKPSR